jgi:O-antigen/teichoic acid export membrane protein
MLRRILAVVAGLVAFIALVAAFDGLSGALFPAPAGFDPNDIDSVRAHIENMPVVALVIVLAGSTLGALGGSFLTGFLIGEGVSFWPVITGVVGLCATMVNALTRPHPAWFVAAAPIGVVAATVLGWWLAWRRAGKSVRRAPASLNPQPRRGRRSQGA